MTWGLMRASGGSRGSMVRQSKASRRETCPEAGSLMTRGQLDGRCDAGAAEEARCTGMRSARWQRLHKRTVSEHHATRGDWKATSGQSARLNTTTEASLTADALSAVGVLPARSCTQTNRKQEAPYGPLAWADLSACRVATMQAGRPPLLSSFRPVERQARPAGGAPHGPARGTH